MTYLISLHGINNSGKTTQARLLKERLSATLGSTKIEIVTFGQTVLLESVVAQITLGDYSSLENSLSSLLSEQEQLKQKVQSSLDIGNIVILPWVCDPAIVKFVVDRHQNPEAQFDFATVMGDSIFCLDVASVVSGRRGESVNSISSLPLGVTGLYIRWSNEFPGKIERINANSSIDRVASQIWNCVEPRLVSLTSSQVS